MSIRLIAARIGLAIVLSSAGAAALAQGTAPQAQPGGAPAGGEAAPAATPTTPASPPAGVPNDAVPGASVPPPSIEAPASPSAQPAPGAATGEASVPAPAGGTNAGQVPGDPAAPTETPGSQGPAAASIGGAPTAPVPFASESSGIEEGAGAPEMSGLPHDLSPWGMFMAADWVVQAVMVGLVFASFVTWTIWLAKAVELGVAKSRARVQVRRLEEAASLRAAIDGGRRPLKSGPVAALALTAAAESDLSGQLPAEGVKERVAVALQRIEARSGRRMSRGTGMLATIGSTAPFVGLFGTVWGIMNSFIGIAETNTTNLAIVAPGIAEALLATGIGLVAAIPAVIIYNVFARSIAGYRAILADGSAAVLRHLSRDLDRRDAGYRADAHAHPAE